VRIHKMAILSLVLSFILVVAACNGDDDAADEPLTTVDATEEVTPEADDDAMTPEDDDAVTPEVEDDEEATPEVTPEATPEDDDAVTDDETPEATPDTAEAITVQVTITDTGIDLEFTDNGITGEATPEAEATPEDDDEATPEATPEDDEDTVTGDADPLDGFSLPSGNITFMITNDSDSERSLVIERADDDDTVTGDATPEATPEDDDDATPEATPEDDDDAATGVGVGVEELDEPVQPGESTTWEVELEPGNYVMYDPDARDEGFEVRFMVEDRDNGLMTDDDDEDDATPEATPEDDDDDEDDDD
jgi:hypothetical protein